MANPVVDALLKSVRDLEKTARESREPSELQQAVAMIDTLTKLYSELDDRVSAVENRNLE